MPEANAKSDCFVGVDLGGTKIYAGVFDSRLKLIGSSKYSTKARRGPDTVIERIVRCVLDAVDECDLPIAQVKAVGVGAPGAIDSDSGAVIFAPNLQWENVPLQKELAKKMGVPVFVGNDCVLSTLGVYVQELKSKPRDVVGVFIGTGIGGGLILDGSLYSGFNHTAGEIGHMVLQMGGPKCSCGNEGCFEALASRSAIFRRILAAVKEGQETVLTQILGEDLKDLRSGDLRRAIQRGDKFVQKVVDEAAQAIGVAVANLVNLFSPEIVVLGGGVMEALRSEMLPTITKEARRHTMAGAMKGVEIIASALADNAGITGAAVLAQRASR